MWNYCKRYTIRYGNKIVSKVAYICMVLDIDGNKDILGIQIDEYEGAKFWISACNDLKNRCLNDILIAWMDSLKVFLGATRTVYTDVNI